MPAPLATVFGGTGFLGRRIVARLQAHGMVVRVAVRHPARVEAGAAVEGAAVEAVAADVRDGAAVAAALAGAAAAVNAVGLYLERGTATFAAVHVEGARRVAAQAAALGVRRLVHLSGIGADAASPSDYVRCRAAGEAAVRQAFAAATIVRPSALFAADDAFLNLLVRLVRAPVLPLFGRGRTRLQPVHADDVAEAVARLATAGDEPAPLYELGGPRIYSYRQLLSLAAATCGRRPLLIPVPFALWRAAAAVLSPLPAPPLTVAQVALLQHDNVAGPGVPGLAELGIVPAGLEDTLAGIVQAHRRGET